MCFELIPSVTERSTLFVKELSFPQTSPNDDAFFNRNRAGACWGHWAGTKTIVGAGLQALALLSSEKTRKEKGRQEALPMAAPMPKSVPP